MQFPALVAATLLACIGSQAHADFVYGLNAAGSKGIYRIDTATGATLLVAATPSLTVSGAGGNGLAFDAATNSFYYARRSGGTNYIMRNQGGVETTLGVVASNAPLLSGTFHNGHYWIIPNGSSNTILRCTPAGSTVTVSQLPTAFPIAAEFGDIASTASGISYAACSAGFRRFDLNALGAPSVLLNPGSAMYQIGFGNTGLFAVQGAAIYSVNTTTGVRTFTAGATGGVSFNDIASIPAPGALALAGIAALAGASARDRRRTT